MRYFLLATFLALMTLVGPASFVFADESAGSERSLLSFPASLVPNFHVVTPGLFRGGQPTYTGLAGLRAAGVKTVINLRNEAVLVDQERDWAKRLELDYVSIPLDVFNGPTRADISKFLKVASDSNRQPVYVHCLYGQDRTGTMIALFRMDRQGFSPNEAYDEMVERGFRPGLVNLSRAVFDYASFLGRTGTPPQAQAIASDLKARLTRLLKR